MPLPTAAALAAQKRRSLPDCRHQDLGPRGSGFCELLLVHAVAQDWDAREQQCGHEPGGRLAGEILHSW